MKRRVVVGVGAVVVVLAIFVAVRAVVGGNKPAAAPAITAVGPGTLVATVSATGNLQPVQQFNLDFTSSGRIVEVNVKAGDHVSKGQVLARIDDQAAHDDAAKAAAALDEANARLVKDAGDPLEAAADRVSVATSTADLHAAQRALADAALVAPVDGVVTSIAGRVGEVAAPGSGGSTGGGFVALADTSALPVRVGFSEADSARIRVGQAAQISFDALPGHTVTGTVSAVLTVPTVVNNVVTYPVTVSFPTFDGARPGMTATVAVTVEQRDAALVIPNAAIAAVGDVTEVVVVSGHRQTYREVKIGLQGDTSTEVLSGLSPGERILADKPVAHEADGDVIPPPLPSATPTTGR